MSAHSSISDLLHRLGFSASMNEEEAEEIVRRMVWELDWWRENWQVAERKERTMETVIADMRRELEGEDEL